MIVLSSKSNNQKSYVHTLTLSVQKSVRQDEAYEKFIDKYPRTPFMNKYRLFKNHTDGPHKFIKSLIPKRTPGFKFITNHYRL